MHLPKHYIKYRFPAEISIVSPSLYSSDYVCLFVLISISKPVLIGVNDRVVNR